MCTQKVEWVKSEQKSKASLTAKCPRWPPQRGFEANIQARALKRTRRKNKKANVEQQFHFPPHTPTLVNTPER